MKKNLILMTIVILSFSCSKQSKRDYPVQPVPFTDVQISDAFWTPRLDTNRIVTIPFDFKKCEETGRIDNFAKAGGLMKGKFVGIRYNDSDVYKIIEGASYSLSIHPDPKLEKYLDNLIDKIAAAQEDDGYLYTARTIDPKHPAPNAGDKRWSNLKSSHELYNVGHMYEAAVAYYKATGKRKFLDVAIKNANLIDKTFGPDKNQLHGVPGHQEIEIGLCKLYRITGHEKYLKLAKYFLDQRGNAKGHKLYGTGNHEYTQDHKPVIEQKEAVGHAVRAAYMYSGMADVAALTGDKQYIKAIDRIWENVVRKKLYITGGIGARYQGEAFGDNYELPNLSAYNETCAAVANMLWNQRLFLLHGDAKYIDVLERTLYNGFLSGVSMNGDKFFYQNPLESEGGYERSPWFSCSCCPTNVVRFLPSIPGYVYAHKGNVLYVNLFISGDAVLKLNNKKIHIKQHTHYPWDGKIKIIINPENKSEFTVNIRIPEWAQNKPLPGDLYKYMNNIKEKVILKINGKDYKYNIDKGYAVIKRIWDKDDEIYLYLPMPVRKVLANKKVKSDTGELSFERGPIVYCAEWPDNNGHALNLLINKNDVFKAEFKKNMLNGITIIKGKATALSLNKNYKTIKENKQDFVAIPYYSWAHRGTGEMAVWLPYEQNAARPSMPPTLASSSKVSASYTYDFILALNDRKKIKNSNDHTINRFTWWDHKGTNEWVQYDFKKVSLVSSVEVYWFDDRPEGGCRVPESWRVLYKKGNAWKPVKNKNNYEVQKDKYNKLKFNPVKTSALRLEVKLQNKYSGGILEWQVK